MNRTNRDAPSWFKRARQIVLERIQALLEFVKRADLIEIVSVLSLFLAVIFTFDHWLFEIAARFCFFLFLLYPKSIRSPFFWLALALSATVVILQDWYAVDNHKYLLLYWLWILFVCHVFAEPEQKRRTLLFNARFFLCFIFLAAAAQKLLSPTYRSGEMFEYYLYVDSRFTAFSKLIGIDPSVPDAVKKRIALFRSAYTKPVDNELELPSSDRAHGAGLVMTWWDASLQALIGFLFLFRLRATDKLGHVLLLIFIFTTYLPAPVFGFGWILAIMGLTLAKQNFPRIALVYMISFIAIIFYQLPWRDWVLRT